MLVNARRSVIFRSSTTQSRGLRSAWELMLKQAALEFGRGLVDLKLMEMTCVQLTKAIRPPTPAENDQLRHHCIQVLGNLKRVCILSDLDEVLPEIDRFGHALVKMDFNDLKSRAEHLRNRLYDELKNEYYLQVDRSEVRFYDQDHLFGEKVSARFKAAAADIKNAGNCLALQQPDACVFHLMRAMEVVVRDLARRLKMTITPQTTWRQLTGNMDVKIRAMPEATNAQKHKKNEWEANRANLHHVGSVWRNTTMHPATSYTRAQARDVFDAVRVFMTRLCEL
jgi:hypothetical protein